MHMNRRSFDAVHRTSALGGHGFVSGAGARGSGGLKGWLRRRRARGATSVEQLVLTGAAVMGLTAVAQYGETVSMKLACLGAMVEGEDIGCRDPSEQALKDSISALIAQQPSRPGAPNSGAAGPAPVGDQGATPVTPSEGGPAGKLTQVTFRVTDDVDHNLVGEDEPGRNMETAGNSTLTWVYGEEDVVGVCGTMADAMGISKQELFSGGTCVQVGGKTFRVQDRLEDGQGCNGDPQNQHLDFHRDVESEMQGHMNASIQRVDCPGTPSHRTVFCPDGGSSAKVRFDGSPKPVKSARIVGGGAGESLGEGNLGFFRFNGLSAGQHEFEVTYSDGTTETIRLDVPAPSSLAGTQVPGSNKDGEGMERAGEICTFDIAPGESAADRFTAAQGRQGCIEYLAQNDDASRADAERNGGCAP